VHVFDACLPISGHAVQRRSGSRGRAGRQATGRADGRQRRTPRLAADGHPVDLVTHRPASPWGGPPDSHPAVPVVLGPALHRATSTRPAEAGGAASVPVASAADRSPVPSAAC
jgi:hypothetical protein